jgi:hypothetical protein
MIAQLLVGGGPRSLGAAVGGWGSAKSRYPATRNRNRNHSKYNYQYYQTK